MGTGGTSLGIERLKYWEENMEGSEEKVGDRGGGGSIRLGLGFLPLTLTLNYPNPHAKLNKQKREKIKRNE